MSALRVAERAGRWLEARALAESLWAEGHEHAPIELALDAAIVAARAMANEGDLPSASTWLRQVLAYPRTTEAPVAQSGAWVLLASLQASLGDGPAAVVAIQRAVELLAVIPVDADHRQRAYNGLALTYSLLGFPLHAARMASESLRMLPPAAGDSSGQLRRLNLAMMLIVLHDQSAGLPDSESGQDWLAQAHQQLDAVEQELDGLAPWLGLFHRVLRAGIGRRRGQVDEAIAALRQALVEDQESSDTLRRYVRQELAQSMALRGTTREEARILADALLREVREQPGASTSMWQLENISQLAEVAGRPDEAYQALSRAMVLMRRNVVALLDVPATDKGGVVDTHALRLFNAELEMRNRELARSVQDISRVAQFDALTGVLNRRGLEIEFGRLQGSGDFALAMLDVDHFKSINDAHSHLIGDAVLRRLGATLQEHLRAPDIVGRWGGEEFLVFLNGAGEQRAMLVAERLRQQVEVTNWTDLAPALCVTVSIGVAVGGANGTFSDVVHRADRALYEAKRLGRNRVSSA